MRSPPTANCIHPPPHFAVTPNRILRAPPTAKCGPYILKSIYRGLEGGWGPPSYP